MAFLNYVLGAILLGSPLPFASLKRIGYGMMKDSIAGVILITSFNIILTIISFIRGLVGASPEDLNNWFSSQLVSISEKLVALRMMLLTSNPVFKALIEPVVSSIASLLSTAYISLLLLRIIYIIITTKGALLIALGLLLYTIPLGVFKRAGSFLISFVIISMIALPAIPNFVNFLASNIALTNTNAVYANQNTQICYPVIILRDLSGNNVSYGYAKFYFPEDPNNIIAAYPANVNGVIDTRSLGHGLPIEKNIFSKVEIYGWLFETSNSLYFSRDCLYNQCIQYIKISGILTSDPPYIIIHTPYNIIAYNYTIEKLDLNTSLLKIFVLVSSEDNLYVTFPSTTTIASFTVNGVNTVYKVLNWTWSGVSGSTYVSRLDPGLNFVEIYYSYASPPQPQSEVIPYGDDQRDNPSISLETFLSDATAIFVISTLLPSIYMTLILIATNALSRILSSGRYV